MAFVSENAPQLQHRHWEAIGKTKDEDLRGLNQPHSLQLGNWSPLLLMIGNQSRRRNSTFSNGAATNKFDSKLIQARKGGRRLLVEILQEIYMNWTHTGAQCHHAILPMRRSWHLSPSMSIFWSILRLWCKGKPCCLFVESTFRLWLFWTCVVYFSTLFLLLERQECLKVALLKQIPDYKTNIFTKSSTTFGENSHIIPYFFMSATLITHQSFSCSPCVEYTNVLHSDCIISCTD